MVDRIRDTAQSHDRCSVVEVMGRRAGTSLCRPALPSAPPRFWCLEVPYDLERDVIKRMRFTQMTGKKHFIVIVAGASAA